MQEIDRNVSRYTAIMDITNLALPIAGFSITTILSSIICGLILAHLGDDALAAGALIAIIQSSLMIISTSALFSISPVVARLDAERDFFAIGGVIRQGHIFALLVSFPAVLIIFLIKPILHLFGQPKQIVEIVNLYFQSYLWGIPASILLTNLQQFLLGTKKIHIITLIGISGFILTLILGYGLTFGKLGLPKLGVTGLGYSQSIRAWTILITLSSVLYFKNEFKIFGLYIKNHTNKLVDFKRIVTLGWPISIHAAAEFLSIFAITIIAGTLSPIPLPLAAQQVAAQYILLFSIPMLALGQSSSLMVGRSIAKNQPFNILRYGNTGIALGISIGITILTGFILFPNLFILPYIDINNPTNLPLIAILKPFFLLIIISQIFEFSGTIGTFILRAGYETKTPMIINLICRWGVIVPLSYLLSKALAWGINGIAIAQIIGLAVCTALIFYRWKLMTYNTSNQYTQIETMPN